MAPFKLLRSRASRTRTAPHALFVAVLMFSASKSAPGIFAALKHDNSMKKAAKHLHDRDSAMATLIASQDWARTPLGALDSWPASLRAVLGMMLDAPEPMCLLWGESAIHLYNDAFIPLLNGRHPHALGQPFTAVWPEAAHLPAARFASVQQDGRPVRLSDQPWLVCLDGITREHFFDINASAIRGESGSVAAVLQRFVETTARVQAEQQLRSLEAQLGQHKTDLTVQLALADAMRDASLRQRSQVKSALRDSEERLRLAMLAGRLAAWDWDLRTGKVIWSDEHYLLHGYEVDEIIPSSDTWAERLHPDDLSATRAAMERAMRSRGEYVHRFRVVLPTGLTRWCSARGRCFYDAAGRPVRMLGVTQDVSDEVRAHARLRDIERRQRTLIEGVPHLIWRARDDGRWHWCSPQWSSYTGLSAQDSCDLNWLRAIHPADREQVRIAWREAVQSGVFDLEYRILAAGGQCSRWFQTRATSFRNEEDGVLEWLGTSTDIHDLREARERHKVLVAELQHRTRNLISLVKSIAGQTLDTSDSLEDFSTQFDDRLGALARVQGLLSRSDQEPITIGTLVRMELEALGSAHLEPQIRVSGPDVRLRNSMVQTVALAIHELATNAVKYGALLTPAGRLHVSWQVREEADGARHLLLDWLERGDGEPLAAFDTVRAGYGRELIESMLPYVLNASTRYTIAAHGVHCTIDLPLRTGRKPGAAAAADDPVSAAAIFPLQA